jgi:4-amino-4-deoxy-L-arabinose transferase-like glycosyltransferase
MLAVGGALAVRLWNALRGPLLLGYDSGGHVAYVQYLDLYRSLPWPDQGWSYFHPPLHYLLGWLLAQANSTEVLLRGLALWGSLASLAVALLASLVTSWVHPNRPGFSLVAFTAVAFLPVHLYASPMVGNELTVTLWTSLVLVLLVANERRRSYSIALAAATGLAGGLALLTKFSGAVALAIASVMALLGWRRSGPRRALIHLLVIWAVAGAIALPYYQRNIREFGSPVQMGVNPLVVQIELRQPPGFRTLLDFVRLHPRSLIEPDPLAPHLLHSVWGTAYVNTWVDTRGIWQRPAYDAIWQRLSRTKHGRIGWAKVLMSWLGLPLTALFLGGAALAMWDVVRRRRTQIYVPLLVTSATVAVAFAAFAARVPTFAALKATYLLALSVPFGVFVVRAIESLEATSGRWARPLVAAAVLPAPIVASLVFSSGLVLPQPADNATLGQLHLYFGAVETARSFYEERVRREPTSPYLRGQLGSVELAAGNVSVARRHYDEAVSRFVPGWNLTPGMDLRGQASAAAALEGDPATALDQLATATALEEEPWLLGNQGVMHALLGEHEVAVEQLERALLADPDFVAGWHNLATVLRLAGRDADAREASCRGALASGKPPRRYPYGVGRGLFDPFRPVLWLEGMHLRLGKPPFRETCPGPETQSTDRPRERPASD